MQTPAAQPAKDNLLGICHAIGEDFGFNPIWLRLVLAVGIVATPEIVLTLYAILGAAVLASRLLTRRRTALRKPAAVVALSPRAEPVALRLAA